MLYTNTTGDRRARPIGKAGRLPTGGKNVKGEGRKVTILSIVIIDVAVKNVLHWASGHAVMLLSSLCSIGLAGHVVMLLSSLCSIGLAGHVVMLLSSLCSIGLAGHVVMLLSSLCSIGLAGML